MRTYVYIVSNLNLVIQFNAIFDNSIFDCSPVNRCTGTNLNMVTDNNST